MEKDHTLTVLKAALVGKACRGRYINVRKTLRELSDIDDAMYDAGNEDTVSMKALLEQISTKQVAKPVDNGLANEVAKLSNVVNKFISSLKP